MSSENKASISPAQNGPYIVKGLKKLTNKNGSIETSETIALCRCGASNNKPFCDGTHSKIEFSSEKFEDSPEDKKVSYKGREITIHDNRSICAHAGYCTDNLASVFRMGKEPWIDPDTESVNDVVAVIKKCPSGALSYTLDGNDKYLKENEPVIKIAPNGPYVVLGGIELSGTEWAEGASKTKYTLCRCGVSKNKPFCDGSHWRIEFSDEKN